MRFITLSEDQANLRELIHQMNPNEDLLIIEDDHPIARIVAIGPAPTERTLGTMAGTVLYMAPDFDAPLDDFL